MFKRALFGLAIILTTAGLLFTAPAAQAAVDRSLKVLRVFPTGETSLVKQFTIIFNQPMVPVGEMDRTEDQVPATITPDMPGKWRWINVYTLVFEPETPLEGSVEGTIRVKAEAESMSGMILGFDVVESYSLPPIQLNSAHPERGSSSLDLTPTIALYFNQPLRLNALRELTSFIIPNGRAVGAEVWVNEEANEDRRPGQRWEVLVKPKRPLPKDAGITLLMETGLKSQSGPLESQWPIRVKYRTFGPFQVEKVKGYVQNGETRADPASRMNIHFTNPVKVKSALDHIQAEPAYDFDRLLDLPYMEDVTSTLWLPGPFHPDAEYTFTFSDELTDTNGQSLTGQKTFTIATGDFSPYLQLVGAEGVLENGKDPTYPFQARNVKEVRVRGMFAPAEEIIPFFMGRELYNNMYASTQDLLKNAPEDRVRTENIAVETPKNTLTYQPVHLKRLFDRDVTAGLMYIDVSADEVRRGKEDKRVYDRALVQVGDIGLSAKFGARNTLIWTTDLNTGKVLPEVKVEIRDTDNKVRWSGTTDENGLAQGPGGRALGEPEQGGHWYEPAYFVLAYHDGQVAFLNNKWSEGVAPWNFSVSAGDLYGEEENLTWTLTSLPLYKPGEEVEYKLIQRISGPEGLRPAAGRDLQVEIHDSRGNVVETSSVTLNRFGSAAARYQLPANAPLGHYSIQAGPASDQLRPVGSFQVEMYRKPDFEVSLTPKPETGYTNDRFNVTIEAVYHFGAPAADLAAHYTVTANPAGFQLPRFNDYRIQDDISDTEAPDDPTPVLTRGDLRLDDQGRAEVQFTASPAKRPGPRRLQVETTVTGVDQRTVSARKNVLVHPAALYVGLKSQSRLVEAGDAVDVSLIAAKPDGRLVSGAEVDLVLYRRTWQTVRRKGVGGFYEYVSKVKDEVKDKRRATTGDSPQTVSFEVDDGGYYFVAASAEDDQGRAAQSAVGFYAYGGASAGWEFHDHDRIDLIADQEKYQPGDTARILVKSPFTSGTGLLTVERSGVRETRIFPIENASPSFEVPLTEDDAPNVYVSVLLVRGRISEKLDKQGKDPGKPAFKVGYVELPVDSQAKKLDVTVSLDKDGYRPGEEVEASVQVKGADGRPLAAEVALVVADAALLQLASENVYYPQNLFFSNRPLSVWTADLRLHLIGRRHYGLKGASPGGGGLGAGGERFRQKFVSLAYFNPHLVTDEDGRATVRFKLPDNLTTFKIFAAANDDTDRFGTGTSRLTVSRPLLIKSALPNFAGVGDVFMANIAVHNQSDDAGRARVTLEADGVDILSDSTQTIELAANDSRETGFEVKALAGDQAVFRFRVSMQGEKDAAEYRIPLRFPNPLRTSATYGRVEDKAQTHVQLPRGSDRDRGGLKMTVSPSLTGSFEGSLAYLADYPHLCLEQKTSMAQGDLFRTAYQKRLGLTDDQAKAARQRVTELIAEIPAYQSHQGGMSFWSHRRDEDPYLTCYTLDFMLQAQERGWNVPHHLIESAVKYIVRVVNHNQWPKYYSNQARRTTSAYAAVVLTEAGRNTASFIEMLYNRRQDMNTEELALLLEAVGLNQDVTARQSRVNDLTQRLFQKAVMSSGELYFEEVEGLSLIMSSRVRTNAHALSALLTVAPESREVDGLTRWLVMNQRGGHWGDTQSIAAALSAMSKYIEVREKTPPDFTFSVEFNNQAWFEASFDQAAARPVEKTRGLKDMTPGEAYEVDMAKTGDGAAYYAMRLQYAPQKPVMTAKQAGLAVSRTYTLAEEKDAKPQTTFKRGDLVRVEVTLLAPKELSFPVLTDRPPAGLEPVNLKLAAAPKEVSRLLKQGQKPLSYFQKYWYDHQETRKKSVNVYGRRLPAGAYTFSYIARAVTPGEFIAPGATAEEMYAPEVMGLSEGQRITVK